MIERSALEEMFANIREKTDWNIDGPMLWGYFFTDQSSESLVRLSQELEARGYRFVDIFAAEPADDEEPYSFLHVERVETHTVESLQLRNAEFYALADQLGIDAYDGMDVGPANA